MIPHFDHILEKHVIYAALAVERRNKFVQYGEQHLHPLVANRGHHQRPKTLCFRTQPHPIVFVALEPDPRHATHGRHAERKVFLHRRHERDLARRDIGRGARAEISHDRRVSGIANVLADLLRELREDLGLPRLRWLATHPETCFRHDLDVLLPLVLHEIRTQLLCVLVDVLRERVAEGGPYVVRLERQGLVLAECQKRRVVEAGTSVHEHFGALW
mmetsp:Transcript_4773/g.7780  ORF Transcript_4773/g.7780 Transcript_4773/m.7780 type:complete len:216 (-) Transcript_4773:566-1213(-)